MTPQKVRLPQLDVLRGVAILLVLLRHPVFASQDAGPLSGVATLLERFGWTGVDLFFVLSGFLIGGLLFVEIGSTGGLRVRRFLVRRAFKIWPAYILLLLFLLVQGYRHATPHWAGVRPLIPNLIHLQNYLGTPQWPTWSLAVEEHFYLALPVLLILLIRTGRMHRLPWIIGIICLVCLGLRCLNLRRPFYFFTHVSPTHLRVDSLCFGVLLAYFYHVKPAVLAFAKRSPGLVFGIGLLLVSPMIWIVGEHPFVWTIGFTLLYLGYGCVVIASVHADHGFLGAVFHNPVAKLLAYVGFFSYSIYLWFNPVAHDFIIMRWGRFGVHGAIGWMVDLLAYAALATVVGIVAARLVELPALAIRDRFFPSRAAASPVQPVMADVSDAGKKLPAELIAPGPQGRGL